MIPITKPITIVFHEPAVPQIEEVADDEYSGNKSEYVRTLVYIDLLKRGKITPEQVSEFR